MKVQGYRVSLVREGSATMKSVQVTDSATAASLMRSLVPEDDERERFYVFFLNGKNRIKGYSLVSLGTLNSSLVHPREVFRPAIVAGAATVIVAHNHPSGDPSPSTEDLEITRRLAKAGEIVGIQLLDHVIVGSEKSYYSVREHGYLK